MKSLQNSLSSLEKGEVAKKSWKDKLVFKIRDSLVDALSSDEKTDSTEDISSIPYSIPRGKIDLTNVDLSWLWKLEPIPDKLDLRSLSPESLETLDQISIELKDRKRAYNSFLEGDKVDLTNVDLSWLWKLESIPDKLDLRGLSPKTLEVLDQIEKEIKDRERAYKDFLKGGEVDLSGLSPETLEALDELAKKRSKSGFKKLRTGLTPEDLEELDILLNKLNLWDLKKIKEPKKKKEKNDEHKE